MLYNILCMFSQRILFYEVTFQSFLIKNFLGNTYFHTRWHHYNDSVELIKNVVIVKVIMPKQSFLQLSTFEFLLFNRKSAIISARVHNNQGYIHKSRKKENLQKKKRKKDCKAVTNLELKAFDTSKNTHTKWNKSNKTKNHKQT